MRTREEDVVKLLKRRKEKALDLLINDYGALIKSIVGKHLYNLQPMEEECINDVLLAIWDNIDKFSSEKSSFKNWIGAIAKYKAIDYKRKYLRLLEEQPIENLNLESSFRVESNIIENELSYEVESLLNNLKKDDKEIFIKHYIEEKDVDTIAENIGVRSSVIYNRLSRGRKKLRNLSMGNK
ncbi:MAG: sigma-70 family RNA polymerase sigma factor [Clostridiaceae bacterium]